LRSLVTGLLLVVATEAAPSFAHAHDVAVTSPESSSSAPSLQHAVRAGLAGTIVGSLGSFEGGTGVLGQVGWSPLPSLWATATVERAFALGGVACDCAEALCCQGANAPFTWLGIGGEAHATPRRLVDLYAGAEFGMVVRNAWRWAARAQIGFDVRLGPVAFGPFAGVLTAAHDSLFNSNESYTFTGGLRLMAVIPLGKP